MPLYVYNGGLLRSGSALATDEACCCAEESCCCDSALSTTAVSYTIQAADIQSLFGCAPGSPAQDCDGNPTEPTFSDISGSITLTRCECINPGPNVQRPYVGGWSLIYTSPTVQYCGEFCEPGECCCIEGVFRIYLAATLYYNCASKSWQLTLHANVRYTFSAGTCSCYAVTDAINSLNSDFDVVPTVADCEDPGLIEYGTTAQALCDSITTSYSASIGDPISPADPCDPSGNYGDWGTIS
jgi:hypothetical protein